MLPLRYTKRWQLAGIAVLIAVLIIALAPSFWFEFEMPDVDFPGSDKALHCLTFAFLTLWFAGQYSPQSYWRLAVGMLAFGALIELCQAITSYRDAETLDVLADAIGIVLGLIVAVAGVGGWSLKLENWLLVRR